VEQWFPIKNKKEASVFKYSAGMRNFVAEITFTKGLIYGTF